MSIRIARAIATIAVSAGLAAPDVALAQSGGRARVLIVSGVAGEPQYADAFHKQATSMMDALKTRFGVPDSDVVYLAETTSRDAARIKGASTKENIERELAALGARSKAGDVLFVMLIGHGSGDARDDSRTSPRHRDVNQATRWKASAAPPSGLLTTGAPACRRPDYRSKPQA